MAECGHILHCTVEMCEQQQAPGMHMLVIHIQDMYIQLPLKYIDIYARTYTCIRAHVIMHS